MSGRTILVWFRNDLRIHDNEILIEAVKRSDQIVPVYCFDPRYFELTRYGTRKTGFLRTKFLLESVEGLRKSLRQLGGDLIIRLGKPEDILPEICSKYDVSEVYHHREVASMETEISAIVEEALWKNQINLKHFIGHTLYHKEDLPFPIRNIPNDFATFRKKIERDSVVKPCFDTPVSVTIPAEIEVGELPSLTDLNFEEAFTEGLGSLFTGGEQEGQLRLEQVMADPELKSKGNRNLIISSKLSCWLSLGCLSSREVYWAVKKNKTGKATNDVEARIILELQWRDFFRFMLKKHGSSKLEEKEPERELSSLEEAAFAKWRNAETESALINACMSELNMSGFISEAAKQYLSSYLVNELNVLWRAGAAYFEEKAIDFSPASDWGNWAYILGSELLSSNRPVSVKPEEIAEEKSIKKWLLEQSSVN